MTILGIGKGRLARTEAGAQDLRCGTQQRGSTVQSESVRAFFHNAYAKLGECLPDKFIRRSKSKRSCGSDSSDGEVASDPGDDDRDLLEWLDRSDTAVLVSMQLLWPRDGFPRAIWLSSLTTTKLCNNSWNVLLRRY